MSRKGHSPPPPPHAPGPEVLGTAEWRRRIEEKIVSDLAIWQAATPEPTDDLLGRVWRHMELLVSSGSAE